MNAKHRKAAGKKHPNVWKSALIALPVTALLCLLLLLLTTALLLCTKDPIRYRTAAGLAVLYLTSFLGGACTARVAGRQFPLLCGLLCGGGLFLLLTVPALFLKGDFSGLAKWSLFLHLPIPPLSLAGAFFACRKKKARRPKRKR